MKDKEFRNANKTLDGLLKSRMRDGTSLPTKHKEVIEDTDLKKIANYFTTAPDSPVALRYCVWYNLSLHYVTRGLEFHHQLKLNSFEFHEDEYGEYVTLTHETQQKNFQGGLRSEEAPADKRIVCHKGDKLSS